MNFLTIKCSRMLGMRMRQILLIMRFMGLFMMAGLLHLHAASNAQSITLKYKTATLETVFKEIKRQSGYNILCDADLLKNRYVNNIDVSNAGLEDALTAVLKSFPLTYVVSNKTVVVKRQERVQSTKPIVASEVEIAPPIKVTGVITNEDGEPMPAVTVSEKGTRKAVITDNKGTFEIEMENAGTLVFTFIGYQPREVEVSSVTHLNITLTKKEVKMAEVAVTALGIRREKKALGYAVGEVKGEDLQKAKDINVINSLAGRVPGLVINQTATGTGGSTKVLLRGYTDMSGDNSPLYVVDGVPLDNQNLGRADKWGGYDLGDGISNINPDDIETISVLKGPAASALYGSRAGHGVILITTKKAASIKKSLGIELNNSTTIDRQSTKWDDVQYVYGQGYEGRVTGLDERGSSNNNWGPKIDAGLLIKQFDGITRPFVAVPNNMSSFFKTGLTVNNTVTLNSSNEKNSIRLSYNDLRNSDIVPNTRLNRNSISLRATTMVGKRFDIDFKVNYIKEKVTNRPALGDDRTNIGRNLITLSNTFDQAWLKNSYIDAAGSYFDWNYKNMWNLNPYWIIYAMKNESDKERYISSAALKYKFSNSFDIRLNGGTDISNFSFLDYAPLSTPGKETGYLQTRDFKNKTWNLELLASYTKKIKDFDFGLRFGGNAFKEDRQTMITTAKGIKNRYAPVVISSFDPSLTTIQPYHPRKAILSAFGIFNVGYKGFLFLDLTSRIDATSALVRQDTSFVPGNPYQYYSASGSFVFSEVFKIDKSVLQFGKLRLSWARVGSGTDPYLTGITYSYYNQSYQNYPIGYVTNTVAPNQNLKPTMTYSTEAGFETKFFKSGRVGLDFTWYHQTSINQILNSPSTIASGYTSAMINAGKIQNKGIEIALNTKPVVGKDFSWDFNLNFSRNRNKVLELVEGRDFNELESARWANVMVTAKVGENFGSIMGRDYQRSPSGEILIDPNTGYPLFTDNLVTVGNASWNWTGGAYTALHYKNFSLSALVDAKVGADIFSMSNRSMYQNGKDIHTLEGRDAWYRSEEQRIIAGKDPANWTPSGGYLAQGVIESTVGGGNKTYKPNNIYIDPAKYWGYIADNTPVPFIFDNTHVKVREIIFSYRFPKTIINRFAEAVSVSFIARNPFILFSKLPNIDPESTYNSSFGIGLEYGSLPLRRSFGLNLNVQF